MLEQSVGLFSLNDEIDVCAFVDLFKKMTNNSGNKIFKDIILIILLS